MQCPPMKPDPPIDQRKASRGAARLAAARAVTFKECADRYIEENRHGWRNSKHDDQGMPRSMRPGVASGSFQPRRPR